jgi:hypothetical protein
MSASLSCALTIMSSDGSAIRVENSPQKDTLNPY